MRKIESSRSFTCSPVVSYPPICGLSVYRYVGGMRRIIPPFAVPIFSCALLILSGGHLEARSIKLTVAAAKSCVKSGGVVEKVGMAQHEACVRLFPDRGKRCTGPTDCGGECRFADDTRPLPRPGSVSRRQLYLLLHQWDKMPPVGSKVVGKCQWSSDRFGCRATVVGGRLQGAMCLD